MFFGFLAKGQGTGDLQFSIIGDDSATINCEKDFYATIAGGVPPYQVQWTIDVGGYYIINKEYESNDDILTLTYDFVVTFAYQAPYNVRLRVIDSEGKIGTASHTVNLFRDETTFIEPMPGVQGELFWGEAEKLSPVLKPIPGQAAATTWACCGTVNYTGTVSVQYSTGVSLGADIQLIRDYINLNASCEYTTTTGVEYSVDHPCEPAGGGVCKEAIYRPFQQYCQKVRITRDCNGNEEREVLEENILLTLAIGPDCRVVESTINAPYPCEDKNYRFLGDIKTTPSKFGSEGSITLVMDESTRSRQMEYTWRGPGRFVSKSKDLKYLKSGQYCVTISDGCCEEEICITIPDINPDCKLTIDKEIESPSCFGKDDGKIKIGINGGIAPYQILWSNGSQSTTLENLEAGVYNVLIVSSDGCITSHNITVDSPKPDFEIYGNTKPSCFTENKGSIYVFPYPYNGQQFTYEWSNGETGNSIDGLYAGEYCVTVTDGNGCSNHKCFSVENSDIIANSTVEQGCGDEKGQISLNPSGGVAPYTFSWDNGETGATISELGEGQYCVTITDANGCTIEECFYIFNLEGVKITGKPLNVCSGDDARIVINIASGIGPFTIEWDNDVTSTFNPLLEDKPEGLDNLAPGSYCVVVTDANGCTDEECFQVSHNLPEIKVDDFNNVEYCENFVTGCIGNIDISMQGGVPPYTYTWTGPNGFTASTQDINQLCVAGDYVLNVVDSKGCTTSRTVPICCCTATPETSNNTSTFCTPDGYVQNMVVLGDVTPIYVTGANNGSIDLTVTGSLEYYNYSWTGPNGFTSEDEDIDNLAPGTYCVFVKDGCDSKTRCFEVVDCSLVTISINGTTTPTCNGFNSGSISLSVQGGKAPYTYDWNGNATGSSIDNLYPGNYTVTVYDANKCYSTATFTVANIGDPLVINETTNGNCYRRLVCGDEERIIHGNIQKFYNYPFNCLRYDEICIIQGEQFFIGTFEDEPEKVLDKDNCIYTYKCPNNGQVIETHEGYTIEEDDIVPLNNCTDCFECRKKFICVFPTLNNLQVEVDDILNGAPTVSGPTNDSGCESGTSSVFTCGSVSETVCHPVEEDDGSGKTSPRCSGNSDLIRIEWDPIESVSSYAYTIYKHKGDCDSEKESILTGRTDNIQIDVRKALFEGGSGSVRICYSKNKTIQCIEGCLDCLEKTCIEKLGEDLYMSIYDLYDLSGMDEVLNKLNKDALYYIANYLKKEGTDNYFNNYTQHSYIDYLKSLDLENSLFEKSLSIIQWKVLLKALVLNDLLEVTTYKILIKTITKEQENICTCIDGKKINWENLINTNLYQPMVDLIRVGGATKWQKFLNELSNYNAISGISLNIYPSKKMNIFINTLKTMGYEVNQRLLLQHKYNQEDWFNVFSKYYLEGKEAASYYVYVKNIVSLCESVVSPSLRTTIQSIDEFKVYPNPFNENITIDFYVEKEDNFTIEILNTLGQQIHIQENKTFKGNNQIIIELNQIPKGLYILKIRNKEGIKYSHKMIKS